MLAIDEKLFSMSTVEKMKLMFNNYEQDTSINEYVTPIERKEENDFIEAVMSSPVMRFDNDGVNCVRSNAKQFIILDMP